MASQDRKSVNQITFNRKNIRSLATDKRRRVCDDLAETIARHDQRLIDIRDELGAISHLIQNDDNYQSYCKIHYLNSERKKPLIGYIPPF